MSNGDKVYVVSLLTTGNMRDVTDTEVVFGIYLSAYEAKNALKHAVQEHNVIRGFGEPRLEELREDVDYVIDVVTIGEGRAL